MKKRIEIPYDYSQLLILIKTVFGTQGAFAQAMELSERSMSQKLNCEVPWTQPEMDAAANLLGFPGSDIQFYFFTKKVQ